MPGIGQDDRRVGFPAPSADRHARSSRWPRAAARRTTRWPVPKRLKAWQAKRAAESGGRGRADARAQISLGSRAGHPAEAQQAGRPPGGEGSLAAESAVAASALAGLEEETEQHLRPPPGHRAVLRRPERALPAGELTGDDVIVVASYLPTGRRPARPRLTC